MKSKLIGLFVFCIVTVVIVTIISSCSHKENILPNVVIIFTDDQGYADVGCYGVDGYETPNLDKLATEGMRFTDFYVSQAVCSASRSSLLTGCYAERVSINGALMPNSKIGLNPDEETIADLLKKKGYSTAIFGKWHLGSDTSFLPYNQGFDEYYGLPYSNDMWPVNYDGTPDTNARKRNYPKLYIIDGKDKTEEISTLEDQSSLTTRYTNKAVDFIKRNKDNRFFLYLPHTMPHVPLAVSDKFKGKSENGLYGDVIMEIDWSVGQIMKALKDNGIEDNTIVIFTSDNGPWLNYGNHAGSALPLREGKGTMWEGGPRVPCIIRWLGNIKEGGVCNDMAATIDILPTLAEITNTNLKGNKIDGISILPLMLGEDTVPRDTYYYYYGRELRAVRKGEWKLYFPHSYRSYSGVEPGTDGYPGKYGRKKCGIELYNLRDDMSETNDLAEEFPEIVMQLSLIADEARKELGDALTDITGKGVRNPGRLRPTKEMEVKNIAKNADIKMSKLPNGAYPGDGPITLVNGITGSYDCKDGQWLGYWGDSFEAVIDLGEMKFVKSISPSFLQSQSSWIFLPHEVCISVATTNNEYSVIRCLNTELKKDNSSLVKDYYANVEDTIRYIKVEANNIGKCPDWHAGNGGDAWIFIDEIVIK